MKDGATSHDVSIDHSAAGYSVADGATAGFAKPVQEDFISNLTSDKAEQIFTSDQAGTGPDYLSASDLFGVQGKSAAVIAANSDKHNIWYDSRTAKNNSGRSLVMGSDNYRVKIGGSLQMRVSDNVADRLDDGLTFVAGGFSADGKLCTPLALQSNKTSLRSASANNTFGTFSMDIELAATRVPISYVLIAALDLDINSSDQSLETNRFDGALVNISAISETSTLSERFIHFSCIDGLKGNDAISVIANCVIAGLLNTTQRQTSNVVNRPKMVSNDCLATYIEFLDGQMRHAMLEQEHKLMQAFIQK